MKMLHLIASPRGTKSRTLNIAGAFLQTFREKNPEVIIEEINLFQTDLPPIVGGKVDAKYMILGSEQALPATQNSWEEITEYARHFLTFDYYLISSPMWNFSIPYQLKHYIDLIIQPGLLFKITEAGPVGLATNKKMFCITSRGSDYGSPYLKDFDFQENYLRAIFGLTGITDMTFIKAQPMDYGAQLMEAELARARAEAKQMALAAELALSS